MTALLLALACTRSANDGEKAPPVAAEASAMGGAECAVCGMVVREQPSPRGQGLHRDGTRVFTCSVGDLRALAQVPSPHGSLEHVWVEANDPDLRLDSPTTTQEAWHPAGHLHYVVGFERPMVMGRPVAAFASAEAASDFAGDNSGRTASWEQLRSTPFQKDP